MENHQSEEQQSSQLSELKPAPSSGQEARPVASNSLVRIVQNRPWLVWTGISALLLATIVGALLSLMSTGRVEREPKRITIPTQPTATASQTSRSLPLWLLGAIVLCCAAGSLAIARQLNRPSRPRKLRKRMRHASARVLPHRHRQKRRSGRRPQVADPSEPLPPVISAIAETDPVVTVLAPEEAHPLDIGEESLADMLDIRKQRSLSSILRDF